MPHHVTSSISGQPLGIPGEFPSEEEEVISLSSRIESFSGLSDILSPYPTALLSPPRFSSRGRAESDVSVYSELSDSGISTTSYDVRDEETPIGPFFTAQFQNALQQGLNVSKSAMTAIEEFRGSIEPESNLGKLLRDARSLSTFHSADTRTIAILGNSGEGKSSLINSLLHYPGIAKTSDLGSACTSVVTEYRQQKEGQIVPILIEVEYLPQDQIEDQVRELVWNYRQLYHPDIESPEVSAEDYARVQRESETAWSALQAAFGHHPEFNQNVLSDQSDGASESVTNRLIEWAREIAWPQGGNDGRWTSTAQDAEECCEKTDQFMKDRLWPFTKIIRIYLNSILLKTGIVLADLPGLQDTNLARVQATQTYLMKADYVLIVAKIIRARTDKSLKDSIHAVISRHITLEDTKAPWNFHLAVVCTKTDEIDEDAAKREFCGAGKRIEQAVIDQLKREIDHAKRFKTGDVKALELRQKQLLIDARNQHVTEGLQEEYGPKLSGGKLEVFCISNRTYKKFSRAGNVSMVRASGIPELRRFCHSIVANARLLEAKNVLQSKISGLLNSIELWTRTVPVSVPSPTGDVTNTIQLDYKVLQEAKSKVFNGSKQNILDSFQEFILDFLDRRGEIWEHAAKEKSQAWSSWHWSQYNAWCLNNGDHATSKRGHVNWNGELNWKMRSELAYQWELFEDDIVNEFKDLLACLKGNLKDLESYLEDFDASLVAAANFRTQDIQYRCGLIQREFQRDIRFIRSQASEANESSYMVKEMIPTYRAASQESGTNKGLRQRVRVQGKISGGTLFGCILHQISSDVGDKVKENFRKLLAILEDDVARIKEDISMAMPGQEASVPGNERAPHRDDERLAEERRFKEHLAGQVKKLKVKHEQVLESISSI
ncbi:hypothetical protein BGW36DRAFT_287095 [Talaromyces proteolyticus]|uniref:G domain-containing protein n=1 Tax=Talaromyces proteolyticus TaxID=1131652 RepID=A0AAD4Q025_9EURO|nr:uncharacterized protein BGW36DRAFT_287095 [Talaromyces proteolyticus]KAH8703638.1 hypothetical protein BGW36DRAFT_287095 [Talaromyces proteolyticus]